ncbi:gudP [Symbiodinium sp. CCMP2456]|nr:gudP [Symbiodinium sp. CCMP2456]
MELRTECVLLSGDVEAALLCRSLGQLQRRSSRKELGLDAVIPQPSHFRTLVLLLALWDDAVASIDGDRAVPATNGRMGGETPLLVAFEVMGWGWDPVFCLRWTGCVKSKTFLPFKFFRLAERPHGWCSCATIHLVPNHGRIAKTTLSVPPCGESLARRLNDSAYDHALMWELSGFRGLPAVVSFYEDASYSLWVTPRRAGSALVAPSPSLPSRVRTSSEAQVLLCKGGRKLHRLSATSRVGVWEVLNSPALWEPQFTVRCSWGDVVSLALGWDAPLPLNGGDRLDGEAELSARWQKVLGDRSLAELTRSELRALFILGHRIPWQYRPEA